MPLTPIPRLERRIAQATLQSARFTQWRALLFSTALVLTVLGSFGVVQKLTFGTAILLLAIFAVVVSFHRKLRHALELYENRRKLAHRNHAIRTLDWDILAKAPREWNELAIPYTTDLNIVGEASLLRLLAQTVSSAGSQRLLELFMSNNVTDAEITRRSTLVQEIRALRLLRTSFLTRIGMGYQPIDSKKISVLFAKPLSHLASLWGLAPIFILQAALLGLFIPFFFFEAKAYFVIPLLLLLVENSRIRKKVHTGEAYAWSVSAALSLETFQAAVATLEKYAGTKKPELARVLSVFAGEHAASARLKKLERISGALGIRQNFIMHALMHLPLPWDVVFTLALEKLRKEIEQDLGPWQTALSEFEAFLSLAQFAEAHPTYTVARVLPANSSETIVAENLRHPLIPSGHAVGNPLRIDEREKCILITGSNMSGKSTFLRSIGVNLLLAKAGAPVAADSFAFKNVPLFTSLSGGDSLQEGLSSFYAEVKRLAEILAFLRREKRVFFLIDEIFRGTNNRERLIGSQAYVKEIVQLGGQGVVTTHDLELSQLESLGLGIMNYHFRESFEGGSMTFHYRKERGPCPSSNALQVMKLSGLPV